MTLLEVLLAVTIIASLMGMVASLLGQARAWTEVGEVDRVLTRLQRVGEAMRSQWADRRSSVALDGNGSKVLASPEELSFVTATPLLFPDWPLVVAKYRIEAEATRGSASGLTWRLVYEETRLSGMEEVPDEYALDARGRSLRDSMVLLEGCRELHWERFGRGARLENRAAAREDGSGGSGAGEDAAGREGKAGGGARAGEGAGAREREDGAGNDDGRGDAEGRGTGSDEEERYRWRMFDDRVKWGFVSAVRLIGECEGERFGWVFVVKALR